MVSLRHHVSWVIRKSSLQKGDQLNCEEKKALPVNHIPNHRGTTSLLNFIFLLLLLYLLFSFYAETQGPRKLSKESIYLSVCLQFQGYSMSVMVESELVGRHGTALEQELRVCILIHRQEAGGKGKETKPTPVTLLLQQGHTS